MNNNTNAYSLKEDREILTNVTSLSSSRTIDGSTRKPILKVRITTLGIKLNDPFRLTENQ